MEISKTYISEQPLQIGNVVQLVYDKEGYVIPVGEVAYFAQSISVNRDIIFSSILDDFLAIITRESNNTILINMYERNKLIWQRNINAFDFFNVQGVLSPAGIYILFRGNGVITINNNVRIDTGTTPQNFITGFSLQGNYIANNTIRGDIFPRLSYDYGLNQPIIFGTNNKDLFIGNNRVIANSMPYIYTILLTQTLIPNITNYKNSNQELIEQSSFNGSSAFILKSKQDNSLSVEVYNRGTNKFSRVNLIFSKISNIVVFRNNVFIICKIGDNIRWRLQLVDLNGNTGVVVMMQTKGEILHSDFSYSPSGPVIYTLENDNNTIILSQYNNRTGTQIWSINNVQYPTRLSGSNKGIALTDLRNVYLYYKRLPALIGVVSEILYTPNTIGNCFPSNGNICTSCTGCPEGFNQVPLGTGYICCPINTNPENPLLGMNVVRVDFISTRALSPLIAGAEYFLNDTNNIVPQPTIGRYVGTAIDSSRLIMLSTFPAQ